MARQVAITGGWEDHWVSGEANLEALLAGLSPRWRPGEYVFVVADTNKPVADEAIMASIVEAEGRSLVLRRHDADQAGLPYEFVAGWITLEVFSALHAVGLTSAVAAAVGEAGISCNVIAGYHHDHLLVAYERVEEAIEVLERLSGRHRGRSLAGLVVRRATISDAPAMRELARCAYAQYVTGIGREPAPMTADYPAVIANTEVWVAERTGNLVGLLVLYVRNDHLLLDNIAVCPDAQRSGVGKRLLALADERARAAGLPEVRLYTNAAMTANLAYYPRHGYRETHRASQDGFQRVFFAKPLSTT
jgi:N-acetylglutamate synthase-like GNAT family acetyltransferase